jgi:hypothetical protein
MMAVDGPPQRIGSGPQPLAPGLGTPIRRPAPTIVPPGGGATTRPPAFGGPPQRANSLPATATAGPRASQGGTLPPRRAVLPPARAASWSPQAGMPQGFAPGLQGMAPQPGAQGDPMQMLAKQMEKTLKSAQEINAKLIETANKAADGVKDAVSLPAA